MPNLPVLRKQPGRFLFVTQWARRIQASNVIRRHGWLDERSVTIEARFVSGVIGWLWISANGKGFVGIGNVTCRHTIFFIGRRGNLSRHGCGNWRDNAG